MILTRKEALDKLQQDFDQLPPKVILQKLMDIYQNMSDENLKRAIEKRFDAFVIIQPEEVHHA